MSDEHDMATPAESVRLRLAERAAALEARLEGVESGVSLLRERSHAHAQALTTLQLGHSTLAADVRDIRAALLSMGKVLEDVRLDVTGLQVVVYRGSAVGAAAGGSGAVGLVAGIYALARAMGWVH